MQSTVYCDSWNKWENLMKLKVLSILICLYDYKRIVYSVPMYSNIVHVYIDVNVTLTLPTTFGHSVNVYASPFLMKPA